jgi:hypothetical protein
LEPDETKSREGRTVPILEGDMRELLLASKKENAILIGLIHLGYSTETDGRLKTSVVDGNKRAKRWACPN